MVSGYGTNLIAPLMPIVMERKLTLMGILGLANNEKYKYPNYFQIQPAGPDPADELGHRVLRAGLQAESQAADRRHGGRRCRVSSTRASTAPAC